MVTWRWKGEVIMQGVLDANSVYRDWGKFNDNIAKSKPQFVKSHHDEWAALSKDQLRSILETFVFTATVYTEDDGSKTVSLDDFGIVANEETFELAIREVAELLVDYAEEYFSDFELYSKSPNRKSHLPYIINVLIQDDLKEVAQLIKCRHSEK